MYTPVVPPDLGAPDVRVSVWFADVRDHVTEGDRLVELLFNGVTFDVSAPATGRLVEKRTLPGDRVEPGQVLGTIENEDSE